MDVAERRLVTALFVDVVGSTEATTSLGPERMRRLLDEGFAALSERITRRGGTVEKYVGDAIFALFGVPITHADDAERAVRAAADCIEWSRSRDADTSTVALRIGIETGEALVDLSAVAGRERLAVGSAVNLAARLMQLAAPGEIVIGPGCHEATSAIAEHASLGEPELKGFGQVEAWRFVAFKTYAARQAPFVGREQELAALNAAFERAMGGAAQVFALVGPPGQGKSRLVVEALRLWPEPPLWQARCRPGTEAGVMTPIRQLIESDLPGATPEAIVARLGDLRVPGDVALAAEAVSHSAGLAVSERLLVLSRLEQREIIAGAWRGYLEAASRQKGLVVWVEDVHWADPVLLHVLDRATADIQARLLVIVTARPEFTGSPHLRPSEGRIHVVLPPLDEEASERLARSAGGGGSGIVRAGGNPLFIIELARGGADSASHAVAGAPVTIQAVIGARLDELPAAERELLQLTSLVGDTFDLHDAALLTERDPAEVMSLLGRAIHLGFVEPVGAEYRFQHALIRDVAYGRLPVARRMAEHARYAREGIDAGNAEALAHHWWQALDPAESEWVWEDKAVLRQMRGMGIAAHMAAGERLEGRSAYEESLEMYERALALADTLADRAKAEAAIGGALARQGRGDSAWQHRKRAIEGFRAAGIEPPASLYADMLEIAAWNWGYFERSPAEAEVVALLDEGARHARETADDVALARLLIQKAAFTWELTGADAIRGFLARPEPEHFADAAQRAAELYFLDGRISESVDLYRTVFDRLVPGGAAINEPEALLWYGMATLHGGDLPAAEALAGRLEDVASRRSPHTRQHAMGLRGFLELVRGDWDEVLATSHKLTALVDANPSTNFCLIGAAVIGYGAAVEVIGGGPLPERMDGLVERIAQTSELIQGATVMLPKVMVGNEQALGIGIRAYADGLRLVDRERQWDPADLMPAIALTMLERWDDLEGPLSRMDRFAAAGGHLAEAVAAAVREEAAAAAGGPAPVHQRLQALGAAGLSELLRYRVKARDRRARDRRRIDAGASRTVAPS